MNNDWRQFKLIYIYIYIFFIYHVFFSIFITFLYTECLVYHGFLNIFVIFVDLENCIKTKLFGMTNIIIYDFYDCPSSFFCRLMYVFFIMQDFVLELYPEMTTDFSIYSLNLKIFFDSLFDIDVFYFFINLKSYFIFVLLSISQIAFLCNNYSNSIQIF